MIIDFDEKTHTYYINGDIARVSVTELLKDQGLADNYDKADREILRAAAQKGREVHEDIEKIFSKPQYEPVTAEGKEFDKWVAENVSSGSAEFQLGYKYKEMGVCGTADLIGFTKNGHTFIGDHKTTSKINKEYVSWQVSLYDFFLRQLDGKILNGRAIHWKGATKLYCFHYDNEGRLKVIELEKVPDEEILALLECEYTETKYQRPQLVIEKDLIQKIEDAELLLHTIEKEKKEAEAVCSKLREELLGMFENQGIKSWESPDKKVKVTYVYGFEKIDIDKNKVKNMYPRVFIETQKLTKVKPQLRIKIREEGDEDD